MRHSNYGIRSQSIPVVALSYLQTVAMYHMYAFLHARPWWNALPLHGLMRHAVFYGVFAPTLCRLSPAVTQTRQQATQVTAMRAGFHGRPDQSVARLIHHISTNPLHNSYAYLGPAISTVLEIQNQTAVQMMQHTMFNGPARWTQQPDLQAGIHSYGSAAGLVCNVPRRMHIASKAAIVDQPAGDFYEQQPHSEETGRVPLQFTRLRYALQTTSGNAVTVDSTSFQTSSCQPAPEPSTSVQLPHSQSDPLRVETPISRKLPSRCKLPKDLDPLLINVMSELRHRQLLRKKDKLLVAVSAEQEHLCLAKILMDLSRAWDWELVLTYHPTPSGRQHTNVSSAVQIDVAQPCVNINLTASVGSDEPTQSEHMIYAQPMLLNSQQLSHHRAVQRVSSLANSYGIPFVMSDIAHTNQSISALANLAAKHHCTAVVLPTNATDCSTRLLLKMFGSRMAQNKQQQQQLTPAWSFPCLVQHSLSLDKHAGATHPSDWVCRVVQPLLNITAVQLADFVARNGLLPWWMTPASCQQQQLLAGMNIAWHVQPCTDSEAVAWQQQQQPPTMPEFSDVASQHQELIPQQTWMLQQSAFKSSQALAHIQELTAVMGSNQMSASKHITTSSQLPISTDDLFIKDMILPLLRQHFNPAVDIALTRAAMILDATDRWATSIETRPNLVRDVLSTRLPSRRLSNKICTRLLYRLYAKKHADALKRFLRRQSDAERLKQPVTDDVPQEVADIQARFAQHVQTLPCLKGKRLLVAVSGGQDSLCLLYLLHQLRDQFGWSLHVAHCDHQWRTDSAANAEHVKSLCDRWGLPSTCRTVEDKEAVKTEGQARRWRYSTLVSIAAEAGCKVVVTGHTLTDQVETQLLNLFRGAGAEGFAAMHGVRWLSADGIGRKVTSRVRLVRPLLPFSRQDTTLLCNTLGLPVWVDSTNNDMSVARRNRIRLGLMPLFNEQFGPSIEQHLASYAHRAREIEGWLSLYALRVSKHILVPQDDKRSKPQPEQGTTPSKSVSCVYYHVMALDRDKLKRVPLPVKREAIKSLLSSMPGLKKQLTFDKIESVLHLIDAPNRSRTGTLALVQLSCMRDYELLVNDCGQHLSVQDLIINKQFEEMPAAVRNLIESHKAGPCPASEEPATFAEAFLASDQQASTTPVVLDLLRDPATQGWNDDQLYTAVGHLLKHGIDISEACKQGAQPPPPASDLTDQQPEWQHEVALLASRVATRTLALLIKQRPACVPKLKEYHSMLAGVLSNKEYTLLFLKARGSDFTLHLDQLTTQALRHCASKALPWLWQWQEELTPDKLRSQFQAGLPNPQQPLTDVLAVVKVLLAHGLDANSTVTCSFPDLHTLPTVQDNAERSLLDWAILQSVAAGKSTARSTQEVEESVQDAKDSPTSQRRFAPGQLQMPAPATIETKTRRLSLNGDAHLGNVVTDAELADTELVRLVLASGAQPNANQGSALLLAATAHRGDLVTALVTAGADVILPKHPSGCDLLKWAVDTRQCPAGSGVLQALLAGVKKPEAGNNPNRTSHEQAPQAAAETTFLRSGTLIRVAPESKSRGKLLNGTPQSKSGGVTPRAKTPQPTPINSTPVVTNDVTPMVILGGGNRTRPPSPDSSTENGKEQSQPTTKSGNRLPLSLVMELHRDEALLEAVAKNDFEVVKCLLAAGADVHYKQDKAILMAMGAIDGDKPDQWMPRPRDRAPVLSMSRKIVQLLLDHGADVNAREGRALRQAARWSDTYSIDYILSLPGADRAWLDKEAPKANKLKA